MNLRIAWLSANIFGYELLKEALKLRPKINIVAIITLSEKATTVIYDAIKRSKWHEFGIPVYEIEDINNEVNTLKNLCLDMIIMCGWRQVLKREALDIPRNGVVSFHPTLLPEGRGPAPIINTILEGWEKSGVTMYYAGEGVDNGDIIGQGRFEVGEDDYAIDVYNKVVASGEKLVRKYLPLLVTAKAPRTPQNDADAIYFKKRTLKDNEINLATDSVDMVYKKIRAFSKPYRGAYIMLANKKLIIWNAEVSKQK